MYWYQLLYNDYKVMIVDIHGINLGIYPLLRNGIYVLQTFSWYINAWEMKKILNSLPDDYDKSRYFKVLTNSTEEYININFLCMEKNIECISWNNACSLNINKFINIYIPPIEERKYNVIMISRNNKFKRHFLTKELNDILYIVKETKSNLQYYKKDNIHCNCNHDVLCDNCNFVSLNRIDLSLSFTNKTHEIKYNIRNVQDYIIKSKIGIILSSIEGACYSSLEYLLCGIPVVSTFSTGGRDEFYNEDNSLICQENCESVKQTIEQALLKLRNKEFNPVKIKNMAFEQYQYYQDIYLNVVQDIINQEQININIKTEIFDNYFIRTFDKEYTLNNFIKLINPVVTNSTNDYISSIEIQNDIRNKNIIAKTVIYG